VFSDGNELVIRENKNPKLDSNKQKAKQVKFMSSQRARQTISFTLFWYDCASCCKYSANGCWRVQRVLFLRFTLITILLVVTKGVLDALIKAVAGRV